MRITAARVVVCRIGRNFATLVMETDEGVTGLGDATLNGRELSVVSYLQDHVIPLLIGRDASAIEDTWQFLWRTSYWRRGPVQIAALSAVDLALWDIKGKALGAPVYQLLGGRSRAGVMAYGHASGATPEAAVDAAHAVLEAGYLAVRLQCGLPGMPGIYGVDGHVRPAGAGFDGPYQEQWSTTRYLRTIPRLFELARAALGEDVHLLHDAHHRLTPSEAGWLGRRLEDHRMFWLEDAVAGDLQQSYRVVRQHTCVPLAIGEVFTSVFDCELLVREQLIDYLRVSPVHCGGITGLRKIAAFAEPYLVKTGCHGAADMSPITMAAALHAGISLHNVGIQEHAHHHSLAHEAFRHAWSFSNGYLDPGEAPGLGVEFDEELATRHPYRREYLPAVRAEDGTVGNW